MNRYYYDLHIHSALSPCADADMTPNNICGMAVLKGLNIIALTDHNSCGNCESFLKVAAANGLIGVSGMELTTAEDIHIVCLFEFLDDAKAFEAEVNMYRRLIANRVDIYGEQQYFDENDRVIGTEEYFLPIATELSLEEAYAVATRHSALVYPAHIDRSANGIVSILGTLPNDPYFSCYELNDRSKSEALEKSIPGLAKKNLTVSSDAHYLWDINEAENCFELDDEPYSSAKVRAELFRHLREVRT